MQADRLLAVQGKGSTTSHAARGVFTLQMAKLRAVEHQQLRQRAARMRVAVRVLCGRVAVSAAQVSSDVEPPGLHPAHKWLLSARVPSFPATLQDSVCTRGAVPALMPTLVSTWCMKSKTTFLCILFNDRIFSRYSELLINPVCVTVSARGLSFNPASLLMS